MGYETRKTQEHIGHKACKAQKQLGHRASKAREALRAREHVRQVIAFSEHVTRKSIFR